ncbi:MAG: four helix bundle protein [Candidatus Omnitrophica bacterium]|nr:four helix bundle protein [Candidatus Omnitrophota bacterium]
MAHTFKNIKVWEKAHRLVLDVYKVTKKFPKDEKYGLTAQLRRSASSVPTNIVEGYKRKSDKDFLHFLNIADSSLEETKYHLLLSLDLKYLNNTEYERLLTLTDEVGKMLFGFQQKLKA